MLSALQRHVTEELLLRLARPRSGCFKELIIQLKSRLMFNKFNLTCLAVMCLVKANKFKSGRRRFRFGQRWSTDRPSVEAEPASVPRNYLNAFSVQTDLRNELPTKISC